MFLKDGTDIRTYLCSEKEVSEYLNDGYKNGYFEIEEFDWEEKEWKTKK